MPSPPRNKSTVIERMLESIIHKNKSNNNKRSFIKWYEETYPSPKVSSTNKSYLGLARMPNNSLRKLYENYKKNIELINKAKKALARGPLSLLRARESGTKLPGKKRKLSGNT